MKILRFPITRVLTGFLPGIFCGFYISFQPIVLLLTITAISGWFCLAYYRSKSNRKHLLQFGLSVWCLSLCLGISTVAIRSSDYCTDDYIHSVSSDNTHYLKIVLREKLKGTKYNDRYIGIVERIDQSASTGKILVNIKNGDANRQFPIGANICLSAKIYKHKKPYNPDQFDYGKYLLNKSIPAQIYTTGNVIRIMGISKDAFYYSDLLRTRIIRNLENRIRKKELYVIAALILGQQQDVSPDILHDYQFAGAVHILSVSGLHVGFILIFINFILKFLPNNKWFSSFRLVIILVSLWGFAILAGLSPSVIRSVTMFSFIAIGMQLKRKTNIFHTLLVSIFLILLFEPSFLFDVGFQLSYIALFFILWLQPILSKIWQPKYKIIDYFWQILTVSFAAQIGAFPLSVYYFHQFPGLFFVTNLIIIPFLGVVMALGVIVIVLAACNYTPEIPAKILEWTIAVLNKLIGWVASFDSFVIQDIAFDKMMMLSLYFLIAAVVVCVGKITFRNMAFVLLSAIFFQLCFMRSDLKSSCESELIVFNSKKEILITDRKGHQVTAFSSNFAKAKNNLKPYLTANFSKLTQICPLQNTLWFNRKKILLIDSLGRYPEKCAPDIVVLCQSPKLNLERLIGSIKPRLIIAGADNYKRNVSLWKATCRKQKIPFHAIGEKGFYKLE